MPNIKNEEELERVKYSNSPERFYDMPESDREILMCLIYKYTIMRESVNFYASSYGLKHLFEKGMPSGYISNGQIKGAMAECGYIMFNRYSSSDTYFINCSFNISKRSPCFKINFDKVMERERARFILQQGCQELIP